MYLVKVGVKMYKTVSGRVSAHNQKSLNVAVITLEKTVEVDDEPIDFTDLERAALVDWIRGGELRMSPMYVILYCNYYTSVLVIFAEKVKLKTNFFCFVLGLHPAEFSK